MPLPRLPGSGIARYGEFEFPVDTTETTGLSVTPHYDTAGRTVTYVVWSLDLTTYLTGSTSSDTSDSRVQSAINILSKSGLPLTYTGRGFGDFKINTGSRKDIIFGPKPVIRDLSPVGAGRVTRLQWHVDVHTLVCGDAVFSGIYEFNFTLSYGLDYAGYTQRRYGGYFKVAATRSLASPAAFRKLPDTADAYREKIVPPIPLGFRRESQHFDLDEAKTTCKFEIVDVQNAPNPYPTGIIKATASHDYNSEGNYPSKWTGTLSCDYELERNTPLTAAIDHFTKMLDDRVAQAAKILTGDGIPKAKVGPNPVAVVPKQVHVSEPAIFDRTRFKVSFTYSLAAAGPEAIIGKAGLWRPVLTDNKLWAASVANALGPRGHAKMIFTVGEDVIYDNCGPSVVTTPAAKSVTSATPADDPAYPKPVSATIAKGIVAAFPPPTPEVSWLDYQNFVSVAADTGRVLVKTLQPSPLAIREQGVPWDVAGDVLPATTGQESTFFPPMKAVVREGQGSQPPGGDTAVQQQVTPTYYLTMEGFAVRAGYPVPVPSLVKVNDQTPVLIGGRDENYFRQGVMGNSITPVYLATWRQTYVLTVPPTGSMPVPPSRLA